MKKLFMIAAAASLVATMANAQGTVTTTTETTGAAGATIRIEPEYRTRIKSYVTEQKIRPVETRERIVVGTKVPTDVELTAVPSDWGPSVTKYRYIYSNDRVMLVDPGTRTVVHEIDGRDLHDVHKKGRQSRRPFFILPDHQRRQWPP
jgi:hypothetical protein